MTLKIVIDGNGCVSDDVAVRMVAKILDRDDGVVKFTGGLAVEIRTAKTQKSFKVVTAPAETVTASDSE